MNKKKSEDLFMTSVTSVTLVGVLSKTFPVESGNCFSVKASDGKNYSIVNFKHENLEEVMRRGISLPIKILSLSPKSRAAVIHDSRIPHKWYDIRYCEVCCPESLLPLPQRLAHKRELDGGYRTERKIKDGLLLVFTNFSKMPRLAGDPDPMKPRILRAKWTAKWTMKAAKDLKAYHGVELKEEIKKALIAEFSKSTVGGKKRIKKIFSKAIPERFNKKLYLKGNVHE